MSNLGQSNFLQALGWAVLNSLWQMALLWVIYQLFTGAFKKTSPARKSALATLLLLTGFGWFLFTFISLYIFDAENTAVVSGFPGMEENYALQQWMNQSLPIASLLYLLLLCVPMVRFVKNYRYVRAIRTHGLSKAAPEWRIFVKTVAARLGINKPVHIWISSLVSSPLTIGFLKPIILLPVAAINNLSPRQVEAVLLHELAHIRRYDYLFNLILKFIQSILYFNPFVKAFVSIVEREREKSCDEMVMQFQYDAHGYASALLVLEQVHASPRVLAVAASGRKDDLLNRVETILGVQRKPVLSFNKLAGFMAGLLCVIILNALLIVNRMHQPGQTVSGNFASLSSHSPLYFFTETGMEQRVEAEAAKIAAIASMIEEGSPGKKIAPAPEPTESIENDFAALDEKISQVVSHPFVTAVSFLEQPEIPVLTEEEEKQVREAIAASRRVLTEGQWKEMEKNIAEVMTMQQKEVVRAAYENEMSKKDWKKWEDKLKLAYEKVDWERVNSELSNAIQQIRIDSLSHVYSKALSELADAEKELNRLHVSAIPDSDITLEGLREKKEEVKAAMRLLKHAKERKVVQL